MDVFGSYQSFSEAVDRCEDQEQLQQYRKQNTAVAMRNEFWKQRRTVLDTSDPLEKQRAMVKIQWLQGYFGCQIPILRAVNQFTAPDGLFGIFISSRATLGSGCVIFPHVSILADTFPDSPTAGFPLIGSDVYIGAGAKILGGVVIGDRVRIAPNCCITGDVPANSLVLTDGTVVRLPEPPVTGSISADNYLEQQFGRTLYDYSENEGDPRLHLRKATEEDLETVFRLYKDRVTWFKWKKLSQWKHYVLHHPKEEFLEIIRKGAYHLVLRDTEVIGGFALLEDSGEWEDTSSDAFYLRRAVSKVGYKNLGSYIAGEAKRLSREAGKTYLRLECVYSNQQLNDIWERQGFAFVRDAQSSYHCTLRQWKVGDETL
jgi:serine O-acetyltransferase